jgi:hypothetical protein
MTTAEIRQFVPLAHENPQIETFFFAVPDNPPERTINIHAIVCRKADFIQRQHCYGMQFASDDVGIHLIL